MGRAREILLSLDSRRNVTKPDMRNSLIHEGTHILVTDFGLKSLDLYYDFKFLADCRFSYWISQTTSEALEVVENMELSCVLNVLQNKIINL